MRTLVASILVVAALAAALIGWFGAGWAGVRQREAEIRAEPGRDADTTAREVAADVIERLEQLRVSEARRPYYHYQSLFHDPRSASEGIAVAPSPLASGPSDPLIRGHFQVRPNATGFAVTMPTINDEIPELNLIGNYQVDTDLRRELLAVADHLTAAAAGPAIALPTVVASADPPPKSRTPRSRPPEVKNVDPTPPDTGSAAPQVETRVAAAPPDPTIDDAGETQTIELSVDQYAQNQYSNNAYNQARENRRVIDPGELQQQHAPNRRNPTPQQRRVEPTPPAPTPAPPAPAPQTQAPTPTPAANADPTPAPAADTATKPRKPRKPKPKPEPTPERVTIAVAPLEWHLATIAGVQALVALRRVDTPDGTLTQGLIVDPTALAEMVDDRVPGARLVAADSAPIGAAGVAELPIGGWRVEVPMPLESVEAAVAAVHSQFWGRFIPVAALAALCGMMVIVVVARAERFAKARSRFAAAAAHELRTPLAGLQLYGDMLSDGLGDPTKQQQYAHRISEEASRLGRVVANVLGFSQLERGDLAVHPRTGDAAAAARDVIDRVRQPLERAGVTLEVDLPDELPAWLDHDAVARILGNLIDNAEKYSRGRDPRWIRLTGTRAADRVELAVADSGPGVTAGARLFVPFSRGVGADGPAGLGLGLALSRSLARAMGGDLDHKDGATFVLSLPVNAAA